MRRYGSAGGPDREAAQTGGINKKIISHCKRNETPESCRPWGGTRACILEAGMAGIGRLSAYCGAVSAGCAAACGIAYLKGGGYEEIAHTLVNSVAITSGIICDGAKPSCAGKIAASVMTGILGYDMYKNGGQQFRAGDGIVNCNVEATIRNVGRLGKEGMRETDREIVKMMIGE